MLNDSNASLATPKENRDIGYRESSTPAPQATVDAKPAKLPSLDGDDIFVTGVMLLLMSFPVVLGVICGVVCIANWLITLAR